MANCRVILFVDHEIGYRLLKKVISLREAWNLELVAVVSTENNDKMWWPGVAELCKENYLPLHRYTEPFSDTLTYFDIDWYFLLSWKHIMPAQLINHPKNGTINLHYSLLPEYRGVYPVNWSIIEGRERTGVTYHIVNQKIDDGQIICQKDLQIYLSDTARSLQLRLDDLAYELFDEMIKLTVRGFFEKPQHALKNIKISYKSRSDFLALNEIDLNREYRAIDLLNLLRGKTFFPDSKNLYFVDPVTKKRIYISISLSADE